MADAKHKILTGLIVDDVTEVTIDDVTRYCSVRRERIVELVSEGIIEPAGRTPEEWRFTGRALSRAGEAVRLAKDLEINLHAVAVILDLLDRIDSLHATLERRRDG